MVIATKPANPVEFPSQEHLTKATSHPVKDKENWWSIAADNKIDVAQLIYFNFKTSNPDEINWYLREKVGCLHSTDHKNYRFSSSDSPGRIYIPHIVAPPPPCGHNFSHATHIEGKAAMRARARSIEVSSRFNQIVGAVGRSGRFISTITDTKFWFAKLYEIITGFEIGAAQDFKQPAFVLHFIPIFYGMYADSLDAWMASGEGAAITPAWKLHFRTTGRPEYDYVLPWTTGVLNSIITGVTAHIQGDMGDALANAYNSFVSKYCLKPAPPFDLYHDDFMAMGAVFNQGRTAAMSLVAALGPVPEAGVKMGDSMGIGLDIGQVEQWRADAWAKAKATLGQ